MSRQAYQLHALHLLMQEFRRAPAQHIQESFEKAGCYAEARVLIEGGQELQSNKCKRPVKPAPACEMPKILRKEGVGVGLGLGLGPRA